MTKIPEVFPAKPLRFQLDIAGLNCLPPEATVTIRVDERVLEISAMPDKLPVRASEIALLRALFGSEIEAILFAREDPA